MPHVNLPIVNVRDPEALPNVHIDGRCESRDHELQGRSSPGASPFSRLVLTVSSHCHSPVQPPFLFLGLPICSDIYVKTGRRLLPDEVVSRIEKFTVDEGGTGLVDHLTDDAAQFFVDAVHEVC